MNLQVATQVFVTAFSQGKSRTYPYPAEYVDGLWVMQDKPPRKNPRKIEIIACELEPAVAVDRIQKLNLGWHFVCSIDPIEVNPTEVRDQYKALGYRAIATEWMFIHRLQSIPVFACDPPVQRVETQAQLNQIPQSARQKQRLPENGRLYMIWDEPRDIGRVQSIPVGQNAWVADLYVQAELRGQGYGRALMSRLLQDDRSAGIECSVLLASTAGARLYPHHGYEQIGTLQIFCPKERS